MKYKSKTVSYIVTIFTAFVIISVIIQINRERRYKVDELQSQLSAYADIAGKYLADGGDTSTLLSYLPDDIRITIINKDGAVSFDNIIGSGGTNNHAERPEITSARIKGYGYAIRKSESTNSDYLYYAKSTPSSNFIRLALPYNITPRDLIERSALFMYITAFLLIIALIWLLYKTEKFGHVMGTLKKFVSSVEKGNINYSSMNFPDSDSGIIGQKVISLYKQLETSKKQTDTERERNRQLKQEMTNNIAHELKTPVSSIRGYLEILTDNKNIDSAKRDYFIERAYSQTLRLSDLISDISLITKLEEASNLFTREKSNIKAIADEVITDLETRIADAHFEVSNLIPEDIDIAGNHSLLYSIFRNLIENSINYAGEGSSIVIKLDETRMTGKSSKNKYCHLLYYDTGVGIKEKYLEKIFDRFMRLEESRDRRTGGTGLGLSIVKHAVEFHHGIIVAENRKEGGLAFRFSLKI